MSAEPDDIAIDACWQRIGVQGDRRCDRLAEHVHCHNCPHYAHAAMLLLDRREVTLTDEATDWAASGEAVRPRRSILIFRLGQDWLGLSTRRLVEVAPVSRIHSLPQQRSRTLLGICNVRGALVPCLSLHALLGLGIDRESSPRDRPRLLILAAPGGPLVVPVDEIDGIHAIPEALLVQPGQGGGLPASRMAAGLLQWQGRGVTWLDDDRLVPAMLGSLT